MRLRSAREHTSRHRAWLAEVSSQIRCNRSRISITLRKTSYRSSNSNSCWQARSSGSFGCRMNNCAELRASTVDRSRFPWQANGELAALPQPGARPGYASPMRFDEIAHQRKPDAKPRLRAPRSFIRLPEEIE
jgi:hypothetical protein